jgi:site-specific DNA-methyltransferase (adenine-specific)
MNPALHSSKKHDWRTPEEVLDLVREVGPIALDPCASENKKYWFAKVNWTEKTEAHDWHSVEGLCFMNPPYGRVLPKWVYRWYDEAYILYPESIILTPARPGTQWFRSAWQYADAYCFWDGRITFEGAPGPAPFPSALFYIGKRPHKFCDVFRAKGIVGVL